MVVAVIALIASVSGAAIATTLITGAQIKDGSITGADIKDHSLQVADLSAAARNALRPIGVAGSPGPR